MAANGLAAYRFWNQRLKPHVYDACILPTLAPSAEVHAVHHPSINHWMECTASEQGTFKHRVWEAPCQMPMPDVAFARPFGPSPPQDASGDGSDGSGPSCSSDPVCKAGTKKRCKTTVAAPEKKKCTTGCGRKRPIHGALRSYNVRIVPTPEQERELKRAFSTARHAYNWTVASINGDWSRANFISRRNEYKATDRPEWSRNVHKNIHDGGVRRAVDAYTSNIAKWRKDNTHQFDVHFCSHRRTKTEVINIDGDGDQKTKQSPLLHFRPVPFANNPMLRSECLAVFGTNFKRVGGLRLQDKPHVIAKLLAEGGVLKETCKIRWDKRINSFHFIYVYDRPALPDPDPLFETKRVVATDLGISPPCTWYSPSSGNVGMPLQDTIVELERRCFAIDALTSRVARMGNSLRNPNQTYRRTKKQRYRTVQSVRHKLARERARLRGWVASAHYDLANHLLVQHELVICPKLRVAEMVPRGGRVFGNASARKMLTFSHGLFVQRLESAAFRWPGRHVRTDTGEPGTSRTCTCCGHWFSDLGGSKEFHCPRCGVRYHRDIGGARNNFFAAYGQAVGFGWDGTN